MDFPATSDQLKDDGWIYDDEGSCRECGEVVEFWLSPEGDQVAMDVISTANIRHASEDVRDKHTCE